MNASLRTPGPPRHGPGQFPSHLSLIGALLFFDCKPEGGLQATSDLAAQAARAALESAGLLPEQVGLLLLATTTPDELSPATACRVQALLGANNAVAMDITAGGSGWLFAAKTAQAWLAINPEVEHAVLASDGTQAEHVWIPAGGSRRPASDETVRERIHTIHMDGRASHAFTHEVFPRRVEETLSMNGMQPDQLAAVVACEPNPVLLRKAYAETPLPADQLIVASDQVGDLSAAGLPYALAQAAASDKLQPGDKVLMVALGAGLTWGSTILCWSGART